MKKKIKAARSLPLLSLGLGTVISLLISFGFVELVAHSQRHPSTGIALLMLAGWMFSYAIPIGFVVYAVVSSFYPRTQTERLGLILTSYLSLIVVFAGLYYSISFIDDHNYAVRQFIHYEYEGIRRRANMSQKVHAFDERQRAFNGIGPSFWVSVEDYAPPFDFRNPEPPPESYWADLAKNPIDEVVMFRPQARWNIFGDCVHFSTITMTSVGYGDITPSAWYTRLLADLQAISGVMLFVVALGMALGDFGHIKDVPKRRVIIKRKARSRISTNHSRGDRDAP